MEIDPDPDPTYSIITDGSATSLNSSKDDLKKSTKYGDSANTSNIAQSIIRSLIQI
jgi:hypothetical protein